MYASHQCFDVLISGQKTVNNYFISPNCLRYSISNANEVLVRDIVYIVRYMLVKDYSWSMDLRNEQQQHTMAQRNSCLWSVLLDFLIAGTKYLRKDYFCSQFREYGLSQRTRQVLQLILIVHLTCLRITWEECVNVGLQS